MQYARFGNSGMMVSTFVLGTVTFGGTNGFEKTGNVGVKDARRFIDIAREAGVNAIDTANIYSKGDSEKVVGEAVKGRRNELLIFSKVRTTMGEGPNMAGASRAHIMGQIDDSLKRLQTDWIHHY